MLQRIHINQCPVCGSGVLAPIFPVKDHTVSGESFLLVECTTCTLRLTQDIPAAKDINQYYNSENYISHTNVSKGLVNRLYQIVRRRTIRKKYRLVRRSTGKKTGVLLDLGSGIGTYAHAMKEKGWDVTGLEPNAGARKTAWALYGFESKDISSLDGLPPGKYDAITLWHVLEHVHELNACMQQVKKLLSPSGKIFIAVPNYTSKDASIYKEFWAAYDVPRHLYHFSPQSMRILMENNGLTIEKYKPMWYDSFYISILSHKYKTGRTRLVSSFLAGLSSNLNAVGNVEKCSSVIYIISRGNGKSPNH